MENKLAMR